MNDTKEGPSISIETARALLRHVMEWDQEQSWAVRWIGANEARLWGQVVHDTVVAGPLADLPRYQWLRELAVAAEGWWAWPHEASPGQGPSFVSTAEWLAIYAARRRELMEEFGPEGQIEGLRLRQEKRAASLKAFHEKRHAFAKAGHTSATVRETALAQLLRLMEDECEFNWASSWTQDHEYMLWASVVGDDPGTIRGESSDPARLRELAAVANGWFAWSEQAHEVEFVPMDRWLIMYRGYVEAQKGKQESE